MPHDERYRPLTPEALRQAHPRRRVDLLRKALRSAALPTALVSTQVGDWIALFEDSDDPALLVLLLELLEGIDDERVVSAAQSGLRHRGDGVRLESMRAILDRHPERVLTLAREHRRDRNLEVQLLLAERMHPARPAEAVDFLFEIFEAERDGPRERHALERGVELLVDHAAAPETLDRLRRIEPDFDDPEGFLQWGIQEMERRLT